MDIEVLMDSNKSSLGQDTASSVSEQKATNSPVWLRIPEAVRTRGIGRSTLYVLIAEGKIRTSLIKTRRDSQRGIRLISADSLDEFIETEAN